MVKLSCVSSCKDRNLHKLEAVITKVWLSPVQNPFMGFFDPGNALAFIQRGENNQSCVDAVNYNCLQPQQF